MEFDMTGIVTEVAEKFWDARIMVDDRPPFAELPLSSKNDVKEMVLPFVHYAIPLAEKSVKAQLKSLIHASYDEGEKPAQTLIKILEELDK